MTRIPAWRHKLSKLRDTVESCGRSVLSKVTPRARIPERIVFVLPKWDRQSGGVRGWHYLARVTRLAGYDVAATRLCRYDWRVPVVTRVTYREIVVYPDCYPGNRFWADRIVRFMCYFASCRKPGFYGGGRIPAGECVIVERPDYQADVEAHYDGALDWSRLIQLPCIEPGLFYPEPKTVPAALYIGKAEVNACPDDPMLVFTRWNMTREQCAALVRKTAVLYSQDHHSLMNEEAVLAGCEVRLMTGPGAWKPYAPSIPVEERVMSPVRDTVHARRLVQIINEHFRLDIRPVAMPAEVTQGGCWFHRKNAYDGCLWCCDIKLKRKRAKFIARGGKP